MRSPKKTKKPSLFGLGAGVEMGVGLGNRLSQPKAQVRPEAWIGFSLSLFSFLSLLSAVRKFNHSFETRKLVSIYSSKARRKVLFSSQQVIEEEEGIPIGGPLMGVQFCLFLGFEGEMRE